MGYGKHMGTGVMGRSFWDVCMWSMSVVTILLESGKGST